MLFLAMGYLQQKLWATKKRVVRESSEWRPDRYRVLEGRSRKDQLRSGVYAVCERILGQIAMP